MFQKRSSSSGLSQRRKAEVMSEHVVSRCQLLSVPVERCPSSPDSISDFGRVLLLESQHFVEPFINNFTAYVVTLFTRFTRAVDSFCVRVVEVVAVAVAEGARFVPSCTEKRSPCGPSKRLCHLRHRRFERTHGSVADRLSLALSLSLALPPSTELKAASSSCSSFPFPFFSISFDPKKTFSQLYTLLPPLHFLVPSFCASCESFRSSSFSLSSSSFAFAFLSSSSRHFSR